MVDELASTRIVVGSHGAEGVRVAVAEMKVTGLRLVEAGTEGADVTEDKSVTGVDGPGSVPLLVDVMLLDPDGSGGVIVVESEGRGVETLPSDVDDAPPVGSGTLVESVAEDGPVGSGPLVESVADDGPVGAGPLVESVADDGPVGSGPVEVSEGVAV